MADESAPAPQAPRSGCTAEAAAEQQSLKYLEFVHVVAIQAVLYAARVYGFAKDSTGPLKPRVESMEGTVKTVVGPVYDKYYSVPLELLKYVDRKVGESVQELERRVPPVVKDASAVARSAAGEVHRSGMVGSAAGLARSVYAKYEPAAEKAAASAWRSLNRLPLVPRLAQVVVPTAANISEKYNRAVSYSAEKGYAVSAYLPLVPTERIGRVFSGEATAAH